ncbi:chaplin-C-like [Culex pipiens pallens]|uniref:chaplin-C-like n=1 Tax=Culex pipiens pallens TaxID=42434 RepID=UPI001954566D|nr:chaplin-C-like [Culex pipiens pallens]
MLSHSSSSSDRHPHSGAGSRRESTSNVTKDKEVSGNVVSVPAPMVPPVAAKIEIEENVPEAAVDVVTLLLLLMGFGEGFDAGVGQVGGNGGRGGIGGSGGGYSSDASGNGNNVAVLISSPSVNIAAS